MELIGTSWYLRHQKKTLMIIFIQSAKVIMVLWVRWKRSIILAIILKFDDAVGVQDIGCNNGDNCIRVVISFKCLMNAAILMSWCSLCLRISGHKQKTLEMSNSSSMLDKIMHLWINFALALTRGSSCIKLPDSIKNKKAPKNPKHNKRYFKCAFIVILHLEEIRSDPEQILNLTDDEDGYNWNGLEFPLAVQKLGKLKGKTVVLQ